MFGNPHNTSWDCLQGVEPPRWTNESKWIVTRGETVKDAALCWMCIFYLLQCTVHLLGIQGLEGWLVSASSSWGVAAFACYCIEWKFNLDGGTYRTLWRYLRFALSIKGHLCQDGLQLGLQICMTLLKFNSPWKNKVQNVLLAFTGKSTDCANSITMIDFTLSLRR